MNVVAERNLFINTSSVPTGSGRDVTINLPQGYADCAFGEQMRMTLSTFLMEKKFYDVNETNNTFYLIAAKIGGTLADLLSFPVVITPGNYKSFGGRQTFYTSDTDTVTSVWYNSKGLGYQLVTQIENALGLKWKEAVQPGTAAQYDNNATNTGVYEITGAPITERDIVIVTHDAVTGVWTIKIDAAKYFGTSLESRASATDTYSLQLFSFEIAGGLSKPTIVNNITNGYNIFSDTHELLGGCSVDNLDNLQSPAVLSDLNVMTPLFTVSDSVANKATFTGEFQASLKTLEAVYVRTNLSSSNFQTASFDSGNNLYPFVISSDILAKIPLYESTVATASETYFPLYTPAVVGKSVQAVENVQYGYNDETFPAEYISFIDQGGHTFSMMLNTNHVSSIRMFLTDDKGRLIPWQSEGQKKCNQMYFTATLKVVVSKPM